jgi:hypothetical protein
MNEMRIRAAFEAEGIEKEIQCPELFAISEKYGISKTDTSQFCNMHGVKIRACRLGCFK